MSNLYESLARTLHELDLSSLKDTESIISYENEKIQIEFTQVTENPKNILRKIREKLLERESIFDFIVIINGKNYRLKYPTVVDRLKSLDYKILYKDVVYRATIISSAILFVMLYFTTLVTIPVTRVNMVTDNVVNASGLVSALLITYLISKTFAIRQEKLNRVPRIKELSGKLSAFRKLCHSLV